MAGYLVANILITIISIVAFLIDFVTYPIWYFIQRPWKETSLMEMKHAKQVAWGENEVTYRSTKKKHQLCIEADQKGIDTMDKMLELLRQKYATRPCIATRQIVSVDKEIDSATGKVWKKFNMGAYQWITYDQMFQRALAFGRGVNQVGYPPGTKVVMFADTRGQFLK